MHHQTIQNTTPKAMHTKRMYNESPKSIIIIDNFDNSIFDKRRDNFEFEKEDIKKVLSMKSFSSNGLVINPIDKITKPAINNPPANEVSISKMDDLRNVVDKRREAIFEFEKENIKNVLHMKSLSTDCSCGNNGVDIIPIGNISKPTNTVNEHLIPKNTKKQNISSLIKSSVTNLHKSWKVSERNRRLSTSLLVMKQAKIDLELSKSTESRKVRIDNLNNLGDIGAALFSPLDAAFGYDDHDIVAEEEEDHNIKKAFKHDAIDIEKKLVINDDGSSVSTISSDFHDDDDPITIVNECPEVLMHSPYILSTSLMQKIADAALPNVLQGMAWKRLYSLNRDGDSFQTFLRHVKYHSNTLIVVRTTKNNIFGGLADSPWEQRKNTTQKNYFGTGQSFLFSINQDSQSHYHLNIYEWTGTNNYNQICDTSEQRIAMGGGGLGFGLCLQENFACGTTDHCATFCNDPLVPDGYFEVMELEVFGFIYPWKL